MVGLAIEIDTACYVECLPKGCLLVGWAFSRAPNRPVYGDGRTKYGRVWVRVEPNPSRIRSEQEVDTVWVRYCIDCIWVTTAVLKYHIELHRIVIYRCNHSSPNNSFAALRSIQSFAFTIISIRIVLGSKLARQIAIVSRPPENTHSTATAEPVQSENASNSTGDVLTRNR
jgi:hypothetical protein